MQLKHQNKLRNLRIQDCIDGIKSISFTICRIHHQSLPSTYVYDEQDPVFTNNYLCQNESTVLKSQNIIYYISVSKSYPVLYGRKIKAFFIFQTEQNTSDAQPIISLIFPCATPFIATCALIKRFTHRSGSRNLCGRLYWADSFPNTLV